MTASAGEWPALVTALMAGFLGSGHCFGMCGGIAGALGAMGGASSGRRWAPGLLFNLGRVTSYVLLGGLTAALLGGAGDWLSVPGWARTLRWLTALMILLIGLRLLTNLPLLDHLERAGALLWRRIQPAAVRLSSHPGVAARLLLGVCWGLLPCGLVYSVLLTAASTASFASGATVMLAFGIGTLPSMLGMTWMSPTLHELARDHVVKKWVGASLVLLAFWSAFSLGLHAAH